MYVAFICGTFYTLKVWECVTWWSIHMVDISEKNNGEVIEETRVKGWEEQQQVTICSKAGSSSDLP